MYAKKWSSERIVPKKERKKKMIMIEMNWIENFSFLFWKSYYNWIITFFYSFVSFSVSLYKYIIIQLHFMNSVYVSIWFDFGPKSSSSSFHFHFIFFLLDVKITCRNIMELVEPGTLTQNLIWRKILVKR